MATIIKVKPKAENPNRLRNVIKNPNPPTSIIFMSNIAGYFSIFSLSSWSSPFWFSLWLASALSEYRTKRTNRIPKHIWRTRQVQANLVNEDFWSDIFAGTSRISHWQLSSAHIQLFSIAWALSLSYRVYVSVVLELQLHQNMWFCEFGTCVRQNVDETTWKGAQREHVDKTSIKQCGKRSHLWPSFVDNQAITPEFCGCFDCEWF